MKEMHLMNSKKSINTLFKLFTPKKPNECSKTESLGKEFIDKSLKKHPNQKVS